MVDVFSSEKRSEIMRGITSKDTVPEMKIRRAEHALGFRYRLHVKKLPGCPDIVLPRHRTIIQVRGCFWHQHDCQKGRTPKSNQEYWVRKLEKNKIRDIEQDIALADMGWRVLVVWECEVSTEKKFEDTLCRLISSITPAAL